MGRLKVGPTAMAPMEVGVAVVVAVALHLAAIDPATAVHLLVISAAEEAPTTVLAVRRPCAVEEGRLLVTAAATVVRRAGVADQDISESYV